MQIQSGRTVPLSTFIGLLSFSSGVKPEVLVFSRVKMLKGINLDPEGNNSLGLLKGLSLDLGTANETSNLSDRACSSFISVLVFVVEVQNGVMEGGR